MTLEYNVLAPGPVNLHPAVRQVLASPMIHHRTPEFDTILKRVLSRLKDVFQTENDCYILTSTGSGGMEALLVNTLSPGEKVLGINSGKFGERWCEMAKVFGGQLVEYKVPWGHAANQAEIEKILSADPEIKIVMTQACETSTGVLHDIQALGSLVSQRPQTLFLVDGITALGAVHLPMDEWKIDGLVGGSQKAFMLPTGLSLLSFSNKAWDKINKNPQPRFYFDIRKERDANKKGETFFSSNVSLIRALDTVLDLILEKGLNQLYQTIDARAQYVRFFAKKMGFSEYALRPSSSLTSLAVPTGLDSQAYRTELEKKFAITIMGGQDQLKGKIIRIGHMGYITKQSQVELIRALAETLNEMKPGHMSPSQIQALNKEASEKIESSGGL